MIILAVLLSAFLSLPGVNQAELSAYHCGQGKNMFHDGTLPINLIGKSSKVDTVKGQFAFHKNCQYDFKGDKDQRDWNKLTGIHFWKGLSDLFQPNKNNILLAWRYNTNGWWEVAPYINRNKKWEIGKVIRVGSPMQIVSYEIIREKKGKWSVSIFFSDTFIYQTFDVNERKRARLIAPWFGGENNAPGPYGGKAPHDMTLSLSHKVVK